MHPRHPIHWGARYGYVPSPQVPPGFYPPYAPHVGQYPAGIDAPRPAPPERESSINWPEVIAGAVVGALAAVIARRVFG